MSASMTIRLTGEEGRVRAVIDALEGCEQIDEIEERFMDAPQRRDDSSSLDLPEDGSSEYHKIRLNLPREEDFDFVHGRIEKLAANANVVVEWPDDEMEWSNGS